MASWRRRNVRPGVKFEYSKSGPDRLDSLPCSACNVGFPPGRCRNAESEASPLCLWNFRPDTQSPNASDLAVPKYAGDVLSAVHGFFHLDDLLAPCWTVRPNSRSYPAIQGWSGTVAKTPRCGFVS